MKTIRGLKTILALSLLTVGCAFSVPGKFYMSFAKTDYLHMESSGKADGTPVWLTERSRPWGTSSEEFYMNTEMESGSIVGSGMSDNLRGTVKDLAELARDVFVPGSGIAPAIGGVLPTGGEKK